MSKFINIPTTVTGQPNLLFNGDNITTIIPPTIDIITLVAGSGSGTTITVTSTTGLLAGMTVLVTAGTGAFAAFTTVASVTNSTTFVVSTAPTTTLSGATISAALPYCTVSTHNRIVRLTFTGATPTLQNTNAIAGAARIEKALLDTYSGPTQFNVTFNVGSVNAITVV